MAEKVQHALELPYHRRVHRLEARWFIERHEEEALLELAKLDFNMVQSEMKREQQQQQLKQSGPTTYSIIPAFRDYLHNASVSSSGGALLAPCLFFFFHHHHYNNNNNLLQSGLVRSSCAIFRLCNDLATSAAELERGETTNAITSYMSQEGCSEEEARESLRKLIDVHWKKMNKHYSPKL